MLSTKDVVAVYDTILSSPGMQEHIKIVLNVSRKDVLLLCKLLELGLTAKEKNEEGHVLGTISKEVFSEVQIIAVDMLEKAGLKDVNAKLNALQPK
ncbi:MAG: hypothetical protein QM802_02435 [Agriterribacter sp.]